MKTFVEKARVALRGEDGGPNLETIINISVALIVATALIALGTMMVGWIKGAETNINGFKQA